MAENNFSGVVESLMKGMNAVIGTKTVVGDATQVGDTIILPLVDVSFGVGAGASAGDKKNGGGGGFSAKMTPSAGAGSYTHMTLPTNLRGSLLRWSVAVE